MSDKEYCTVSYPPLHILHLIALIELLSSQERACQLQSWEYRAWRDKQVVNEGARKFDAGDW